jgi:Domain of unknown function (DUF5658)
MEWSISKTIAVSSLCILQLGDCVSTMAATSVPHVVELNPLINAASATFGLGGLILGKFLALLLGFVIVRRAEKMWLVWTALGVYVGVVASNIVLAIK